MRGTGLKLTYQKHELQEHRSRDETLLIALDQLSFNVHLDLVRELIQDLGDRDYLKFNSTRNRKTGEMVISEIQLTPDGRDLVERIRTDQAVEVGWVRSQKKPRARTGEKRKTRMPFAIDARRAKTK